MSLFAYFPYYLSWTNLDIVLPNDQKPMNVLLSDRLARPERVKQLIQSNNQFELHQEAMFGLQNKVEVSN